MDLVETMLRRYQTINEEYKRMKNCENCIHKPVCYIRLDRIDRHANDYSPCENWVIKEKD